jgi:hypothetical protein
MPPVYARYSHGEECDYSDEASKQGYFYFNQDATILNIMLLGKYEKDPEFLLLHRKKDK